MSTLKEIQDRHDEKERLYDAADKERGYPCDLRGENKSHTDRGELLKMVEKLEAHLGDALDGETTAQAKVLKLEAQLETLKNYAKHKHNCAYHNSDLHKCSCGLQTAIGEKEDG